MQKLAEMIQRLLYCLTSVMMVLPLKLQKWSLLRWQIMKVVDVILNIDALQLSDDQSVEDVIDYLRNEFEFGYEPTYDVTYEERVDEQDSL